MMFLRHKAAGGLVSGAGLESAARLAAQAEALLGLSATPSRQQLRAARACYREALSVLDAGAASHWQHASSRSISRRVEALLRRGRWAALLERLQRRRRALFAIGLVVGGLVGVVLAARAAWRHAHPDLLRGRPFRTSSEWARCEPEKQLCGGGHAKIFFHTNEEPNPFIVYDLGQVRSPRRVEVTNRRDTNLEMRAVPLLLQASLDGVTWHELARRDYWFDEWRADFPATPARYLKLQVGRTSMLHLERVQAWE
jgi:hypothetical protein